MVGQIPRGVHSIYWVCDVKLEDEEIDGKHCHKWDPDGDFFETGSLVYIEILNPHLSSTYSVNANSVAIVEERPSYNGLPSATPVEQSPNPVHGLYAKEGNAQDLEKDYQGLMNFYVLRDDGNIVLPGDDHRDQSLFFCEEESSRYSNGTSLSALRTHIDALAQIVKACAGKNEIAIGDYRSLLAENGKLNAQFALYDRSLAKQTELEDLVNMFGQDLRAFKSMDMSQKSEDEKKNHADLDEKYDILSKAIDSASSDNTDINNDLKNLAETISALSAKVRLPVTMLVGQWSSNEIVDFTVCEKPPTPNDSTSGISGGSEDKSCSSGLTGTQSPGKTASATPKGAAAPPVTCICCSCKQPDGSSEKPGGGIVVAKDSFEVHKMYRANLIAGFFVSSLVNRQYGLTNNGQSTSSMNLTYVTVVGPTTRPQYHAFVGVNVYLFQRDVFPGAMARQGFLWGKPSDKPHVMNGYWNPGLVIGYAVDTTNNYVTGLNWETPWGLNLGSGVHIGQEMFLQPGFVPGVTQLPSTTTAVPTISRTEYGWYGNVSFDLGVMKTLISNLFGSSSVTGK
jgi:hypothetical protein